MATVIGVISDTHGLLRPAAREVLRECAMILHAGDIGGPEVLEELRQLAPVTAIRGNVDKWAHGIPDTEAVAVEGRSLYIIHDVKTLDLDPGAAGFAAVISGHSHRPGVTEDNGVLYVNPGSAGPRRFSLPVTVAVMAVSPERLTARIVELEV